MSASGFAQHSSRKATTASANGAHPKKSRRRRGNRKGTDASESDAESEKVFLYSHPKPRVLTDGLFMWELVASFCAPTHIGEVERICKDVHEHLQTSHTSNRLMQRYWNAQWSRLVREEDQLPREKRLLLTTSLSRSEGKTNWRGHFVEEYPLWRKRTFMGKGADNNANNAAKTLFQREVLNEIKSAAEMARTQLTVEEAVVKLMKKRGIELVSDGEPHAFPKNTRGKSGATSDEGLLMGGQKGVKIPVKDCAVEGYERSDYKTNWRIGNRKGKHKKGGVKKWLGHDDDY